MARVAAVSTPFAGHVGPMSAVAARTAVHITQGTLDVDPDDLLEPATAALAAPGFRPGGVSRPDPDADRPVSIAHERPPRRGAPTEPDRENGRDATPPQNRGAGRVEAGPGRTDAHDGGAGEDVGNPGNGDSVALGPPPADVRAAAFRPHDRPRPEAAVVVTNGGWAALRAGIPLVVAGASPDKPEVARRVARSGVDHNRRAGPPRPAWIARVVRDVTTRPGFRTRSRELGAALAAAGGAVTAADLLENLVVR